MRSVGNYYDSKLRCISRIGDEIPLAYRHVIVSTELTR
jgi:hypothetical protein